MEVYIIDWLGLLGRWLHFVAGIAWVGASFYFVSQPFLPTINRGALKGSRKNNFPFSHPVFGPSLNDPQSQNPHSSPARSLSDLGDRSEVGGKSRPIFRFIEANSQLFNEINRESGPISRRRSRFILSPTGS
ncbi:MAG: hypothetical protein MAG794_01298 [Gammaproteobacteria bacterium]|nr:hypothetical protein [Gammaproteobacteria bacterium]